MRCSLGQRLHRKGDVGGDVGGHVGAGCHDRRTRSGSYAIRSFGPAAAAVIAADHDDDTDNKAANHSPHIRIRHVMPPGT